MREGSFAERKNIKRNAENDVFLQNQLKLIKAEGDEFLKQSIKSLSYSDFKTFYVTGSRKEYENEYFCHRKRLDAFAVLAAVYDDNNAYIEGLQNAVWAIADEFTWALPAHIAKDTEIADCKTQIDLFAAETAFTLAEILHMFRERLEPMVIKRIEFEVRNRVTEPYLNRRQNSWDALENNWAAVCAGSVGSAFLYLANDNEIQAVLPRIKETLSCYLRGFGDDGACVEGINYWIYGFGYFTYFAQLLYQYNGENLFDSEKVHNIAAFWQKIRLCKNKAVSFSDCGDLFINRSGLAHFLHKTYNDIAVPDDSASLDFNGDHCYRFAHIIRDFAWREPSLGKDEKSREGFEYLKDAAWYINKTKSYDFAAKAGHNGESHNHNDIGAFLINVSGKSIITDPGRGEYTADYFGEKRYEYFAPSALAHSVPIIDGEVQKSGKEHFGIIQKADNNRLVIDFEKAYDDENLKKLTREFEFSDDVITMRDRICFMDSPKNVTEHFVMNEKPELCEFGLTVKGMDIIYDTEKVKCTISKKTFSADYNNQKTVYTIDLNFTELNCENEFMIVFKVND